MSVYDALVQAHATSWSGAFHPNQRLKWRTGSPIMGGLDLRVIPKR